MSEHAGHRPQPGVDPALERALAQLRLDTLPDALCAAVATALEWAGALDREAAARVEAAGADSIAGPAGAEPAARELRRPR